MNKRYNNISLAWGIVGIVLQVVGVVTGNIPVLLLGSILLFIGLGYYARAKGRNPAWCLMGSLSFLGYIILGCLKDLEKESTQEQATASISQSQDNVLAQLEKLGELKGKGILTDEEFLTQKEKLMLS